MGVIACSALTSTERINRPVLFYKSPVSHFNRKVKCMRCSLYSSPCSLHSCKVSAWPTDPCTKNLQGACNNVICKECVTKLFSVESSDMFEAVGLLKILALSALATRNLAKSRIPKDKKVMFLRWAKYYLENCQKKHLLTQLTQLEFCLQST